MSQISDGASGVVPLNPPLVLGGGQPPSEKLAGLKSRLPGLPVTRAAPWVRLDSASSISRNGGIVRRGYWE